MFGGPGGEADLGDEDGFDPDGVATGFGGRVEEGGPWVAETFEEVAHAAVRFLGEAGAGASGVDELLVSVIVAEQQGTYAVDAEVALGGKGEAADDELLFADAFELEPGGGAA